METCAASHSVVKYVSVNSNSVGYWWHNCHTQSRYKRNNGDCVNQMKIICQYPRLFKRLNGSKVWSWGSQARCVCVCVCVCARARARAMRTFSELAFTMWPNLSQNGWPPATHSFCNNDWKPVMVRKWWSSDSCAKLDITQHKSLAAPSKNDSRL